MASSWFIVFSQLLMQSPVLLAYLTGIVICAVLWRRAPRAASLAMLATVLMLVTTVGFTVIQSMLISSGTPSSFASAMTILGITAGILRAGAFVLLLAAVFTGRPRAETVGFEVEPPVPFAQMRQENA